MYFFLIKMYWSIYRRTGITHIPAVNPNICHGVTVDKIAFACSVISAISPAAFAASKSDNWLVNENKPEITKTSVNIPCCNAVDSLTINGLTEKTIASSRRPVFHSSYSIVFVNITNIVK